MKLADIYTTTLGERSVDWDVGFYEQKQLLTLRKQDNKYYQRVHSQVLQDVLLRLDKAYVAFFKKLTRYPKFKRCEKYNSFTYPQYGGFRLEGSTLRLGLIGKIKVRVHRPITGMMKTCTIIRDVEQWYCCISIEDAMEKPEKKLTENAVGIDLGLLNLVTLSTGEVIENPRRLKQGIERIKHLQRSLSRKKKGSRNRHKARIQLAKAWRTVRNQRTDYTHKVSRNLAGRYNTIIFEKLNVSNMVRNHNLAAAIMDATWSKLRSLTAYKAERNGGRALLVNPSGTSQKCSGCGAVVLKDLSVRMHECSGCGLVLDRDYNAALNILRLGLEQTYAETEPLLVSRQRISKFQSRKQEAHE